MTKKELDRVRENVRTATTEDLVNRATVYRAGMDPDALKVIEEELTNRGVTEETLLNNHAGRTLLVDESGIALPCCMCGNPAVFAVEDHLTLWGGLVGYLVGVDTVGRHILRYCEEHRPPPPVEPSV